MLNDFSLSLNNVKNILFSIVHIIIKNIHFMLGFAHMYRTIVQVEHKHEFKTIAWNGWIIDL
jgi:hypothetical protein